MKWHDRIKQLYLMTREKLIAIMTMTTGAPCSLCGDEERDMGGGKDTDLSCQAQSPDSHVSTLLTRIMNNYLYCLFTHWAKK